MSLNARQKNSRQTPAVTRRGIGSTSWQIVPTAVEEPCRFASNATGIILPHSKFMNYKEKRKLFDRARKEKYAVGQFNVSNLEALKAIFAAAENTKSPFIIGTSEGESKFLGLKEAVALKKILEEKTGLKAILNLDHSQSLEYITEAVKAGYDAVHFDGSKLDFNENIRIVREAVSFCHKKGVWVEGEINIMPGSSKILEKIPENISENLTDPAMAEKFLKETKVDSLTVNIGTFHGVTPKGADSPIDFDILQKIRNQIRDKAFLVLHGGSGVPAEEIKRAVQTGIVKININTDLRIAFTKALKEQLISNPQEITPYKYLPVAMTAVQAVVEENMKIFGSQNKF